MEITEAELQRALQGLCGGGGRGDGQFQVSGVTFLGSGYEADVYAFTRSANGRDAGEAEPLILRLYDGEGAGEKAEREYRAMRRLRAVGYPVPRVRLRRRDRSPLGRPFVVMERIDGVSLGVQYWSAPEDRHGPLRTVLYRLIAGLHALEARAVLPESSLAGPCDRYAAVDREIASLLALLDRLQEKAPRSLRDVIAGLAERRSDLACEDIVLLHGDFHPGNVLLRGDGSPVVIDWSNVRLGDCRSDLAWTRLITSAGAPAGRAEAELRAYEAITAARVPAIELFDVAAHTHLLLSTLVALCHGAASLGMRPGAAARMREGADFTRGAAARLQALTGRRMPDLDDALGAALE